MTAAEREAVRAKVDELTRLRVEIENEDLRLCSGCGMPMSDWTPGCKTCWNRWRNYETGRTKTCPYPVDPSFFQRMRVIAERWEVVRLREKIERVNEKRWADAA